VGRRLGPRPHRDFAVRLGSLRPYGFVTSPVPREIVVSRGPTASAAGTWTVDDSVSPPLNRATRDWHSDFYVQCASRRPRSHYACSIELVNPPAGCAARYADAERTAVQTDTGFGSLNPNTAPLAQRGCSPTRRLSIARSPTSRWQPTHTVSAIRRILWWYFAGPGGWPTTMMKLWPRRNRPWRPLHVFTTPDDDPKPTPKMPYSAQPLRDYLAALTTDLRAAHPTAKLELLWPLDVNHQTPVRSPRLSRRDA